MSVQNQKRKNYAVSTFFYTSDEIHQIKIKHTLLQFICLYSLRLHAKFILRPSKNIELQLFRMSNILNK